MNQSGYKILGINEGYSQRWYGKITLVKACKLKAVGDDVYFTPNEDNTEVFFFPDEEEIRERLITIARGEGIWKPIEDDFILDYSIDKSKGKKEIVYVHASFFGNDYDKSLNFNKEVAVIPNYQSKVDYIYELYTKKLAMLEYSPRGFVESLADSDVFFAWLFEKKKFKNMSLWALPHNYRQEYQRFLNSFDDYEY